MIIKFIGECTLNLYKAIKYLLSGYFDFKSTLIQASRIGFDSISIALTIAFVSGAAISLQLAKYFLLTGAESYVGGMVAVAMVREIAPIFASLAIGARAGTSITAEIANMKVTEQIDAMKTLKVDPIAYLLLPRLIAGVTMVPLVTILAILTGIIGGMWVADITVNLHINRYITSVWNYLGIFDLNVSLLKAAIFGLLITLISSTQGLKTKGGAKEVGLSTTRAAVWTTIFILIFDYFITWAFYA